MPDRFNIRKTILVLCVMAILALITPSMSFAATLVWDPSRGVVDGYIVHWGTNRYSPSEKVDVGPRAAYNLDRLPLSEGVTYYISVSAYNAAGESDRCPPVVYTPGDNTPPAPPVGLRAD
jgi:hypothetical protein